MTMEFEAKSVTTPRGLSQEQALEELQQHPKFKVGSRIKSIRQRGDRWLIQVLEPKTAEFPPSEGDDEESGPPKPPVAESPDEDSDDDSEDSEAPDGPPSPDGPPKDKKEKGGDHAEQEILGLLHTLLDALGLGAGGPEGPDAGPPAPPPGPPGAGAVPEHGGARPGAGRPPGPGAGGAGPPIKPVRDVPPGANPMSGFASARDMSTKVPTFSARTPDDGKTTVKQAKVELEAIYGPHYKVKQVQRKNGHILALLSVR